MTLLQKIKSLTWWTLDIKLKDILLDINTIADRKIEEAPIDGTQYARQDGEWSEVTGGAGGNQDLQSVLDNSSFASFDGGNSTIEILNGVLPNEKFFTIKNGDGVQYSNVYTENVKAGISHTIESEGEIVSQAVVSTVNGYVGISQENAGLKTIATFSIPTANTYINLPAKEVDGFYTLATLDDVQNIDTAFTEETYASTMSVAYNQSQPNFDINLTGNLDLTITGTSNGDGGLVNLYFTGTEVATLNGLTDLVITGAGEMIPVQYIHGSDGLRWYKDETGGTPIDTSLFAKNQGTILYHDAIATDVGTFSNIGTACTGIGTSISDDMVGAKITKANGEVGIITARASDTSFTVSGFLTNSVGTAFEVKAISVIVNSNGSIEVRDQTGKRLDYYYSDGNGRELGTNITCYRRITASNCFMDGDNIQSPKLTVTTATTYANDAAADADTNLQSKELYWITGDRVPRRKP